MRHKYRGKQGQLGWLRTMLYSSAQMVIRADPVMYVVHVALRPDHAWNLASYPYYCKYTNPGDPTAFRPIDCNLGA